ncbi:MAG: hypothetical protein EU529_04365 [Promethearchaeota archaeon]|nr:MAG: hypothetical protein EU529_04365 [Candidatus Lokiarchaeota archaeon]
MKKQKAFNITYLIGLAASFFFMIWIFIFELYVLNYSFLVFFWVVKYLSGFGLILSIANGFLLLFDKFKNQLSKRGTNILIVLQFVIPIIFVIYAIYRIFSSFYGGAGIRMVGVWADFYVWIDDIIYIYGISSLLITLYIIPIIRDEFDDAVNQTRVSRFKVGAKSIGRGIKKKYFSVRKKHAKVQLQDQMTGKEVLVSWRNKFAVYLMIPIAVGSLLLMPLAFILIVLWLKIIFFEKIDIKIHEKIALLISIIILGVVAILAPYLELVFYAQISNLFWTINIFYLIGIGVASFIYFRKII